ncbi:hypothetical protein Salbus254_5901 [Streptomyces albidoflavus]|uniref:hypothetical protein n=1 Tax=Streptomyces albidoflavus TaxID=1886 RepID=UPI000775ED2E|nr:hypothetical protein [Streptomyces albidoflavus]AMM12329.1 hypothetical protein Salbus254_5901 [Streptomyces albidoflavus]
MDRPVVPIQQYTLDVINNVSSDLDDIAAKSNQGRGLDGETAAALLTARSNLAIAGALLDIADAIRDQRRP